MNMLINKSELSEQEREEFDEAKKIITQKYGENYNILNLFTKEELIENINERDWNWAIEDEIEQAEIYLKKITDEEAYEKAKEYFMGYEKEYIFNYRISDIQKVNMIVNKVLD